MTTHSSAEMNTKDKSREAQTGKTVDSKTTNFQTVEGVKINAITRKILRSKKLTRAFILPKKKELRSISITDLPTRFKRDEKQIMPSERLSTRVPVFSEPCPEIAQSLNNNVEVFPPITVTKISNGKAFGKSNMIIVDEKLVAHQFFNLATDLTLEELQQNLHFDPTRNTFKKIINDPAPLQLKTAAVFTDAASYNYAHWLTEVLTKIFIFQTSDDSLGVPIVVDASLHPNMMRSLEAVLRDGTQVYLLPKHREAVVETLLYTSSVGYIQIEPRNPHNQAAPQSQFSQAAIGKMAKSIKNRLGLDAHLKPWRKLYVKRNSGYRNVLNSGEVEQRLISAGFEIIEPEKMSFDEQVKAFHSARIIIGATGAAIANIMFCSAECQIFILISKHAQMPYTYWQNIANGVGQHINYILCEASTHARQDIHADFSVPLQEIESISGPLD
jgi:capsular polysaccharide biosynthesis protein